MSEIGVLPTQPTRSSLAYRTLHAPAHLEAAVAVVQQVWGPGATSLVSPELLRAYTHFGAPVIGAFDGDELCGVSIGFLAAGDHGVHLHSHITGVIPSHQRLGIGFGLKTAQRDWCIDHSIDRVTWTYDPLLARNAHFNLRKLGAVAKVLLPDFYGEMGDDVNGGDASDRLEVQWAITTPRVERALARIAGETESEPEPRERCETRTVQIPPDYHGLRRDDPATADWWRATVRRELTSAFADGFEAVDFSADDGYLLTITE